MDTTSTSRPTPRKPLGVRLLHIEKKSGRAKLPADCRDYLRELKETALFLTFTDQGIAKLYPMQAWDQNVRLMDEAEPGETADALERIYMRAMHNGKSVDMDEEGRFVVPPSIREAMGIEDADVHLLFQKGVFFIYTVERYKQEMEIANANPEADKAAAKRVRWV